MKKTIKFSTWIKFILVILIVLGIGGFIGYKYYQDYLYKQTNEYKLLELGYTQDEVKLFLDKLEDDQETNLIERTNELEENGYREFLPYFFKCDYFLYDKLDLYLDEVITKKKDFFKYKEPSTYNFDKLVSIVNSHANEEPYTSTRKSDISKGVAMIANKHYQLGDYAPDDLVAIPWKYRFGGANDKIELRQEAYDAYIEMWEAANQEEEIYLLALSGYRSKVEQEKEYNYYKDLRGEAYADTIAARPGWSEHQTGLAIDIYSKECSSATTFKDSKTYKWLVDNSYKYGYILRYTEGNEDITGYHYESWHYRYIGKELAKKVHESKLTYDEYYAFYLDK